MRRVVWGVVLFLLAVGCQQKETPTDAVADSPRLDFAIAIHGGAGGFSTAMSEGRQQEFLGALEKSLRLGVTRLDGGASSLDVVEAVIRTLEDDPLFNAGKGAVFNHEGEHELDASIMDGASLACGGVAGVRSVKNPIGLARRVMEQTPHVLLAGPGAERFADEQGVERVEPSYFSTTERREALDRALQEERATRGGGTVGVVALDRAGNLAAGTSTGGLTNKRFGRVGDSPVIGAGTYADNRTCAVSGTGRGEEYIRHSVARSVALGMLLGGQSLEEAAGWMVHDTLEPGSGGLIAVDRHGNIAMIFNTTGMYRGAADSAGRFETHIW